MTRYGFGLDQLYTDSDGTILPDAPVLFYDARTSGTAITDLLDDNGDAATFATVNASGQFPCKGPDGVLVMWAVGADGNRFKVLTDDAMDIITDLASRVTDLEGATAGGYFVGITGITVSPAGSDGQPATAVDHTRLWLAAEE